MSEPRVGMIWAQAKNRVIGLDGQMPWHVPEDLKHFTRTTTGHPVIMGRSTWKSFPAKFRPLPERTNIVLTRSGTLEDSGGTGSEGSGAVVVVGSLEEAFDAAAASPGAGEVWVIGGQGLFEELASTADVAAVTELDLDIDGDTFAPELGDAWHEVRRDPHDGWHTSRTGVKYRFIWLKRDEA